MQIKHQPSHLLKPFAQNKTFMNHELRRGDCLRLYPRYVALKLHMFLVARAMFGAIQVSLGSVMQVYHFATFFLATTRTRFGCARFGTQRKN